MTLKRTVTRHLRRFVPQWLVRRVRARIERQLNAGPMLEIKVEKGAEALRCQVGDQYSFLAPLACEDEMAFQNGTQEGRAELSGVAQGGLRGGIFFDLGAHAGLLSALFAAARPGNIVYSFEPSPLAYRRLPFIRDLNGFGPRLQPELVAIGREKGRLEMLLDPVGAQVQIQRFRQSMLEEPERIEVEVETVAGAAARLGVIPDFIKFDIEGFEYEAIEGARDFLAQHRPELFIELHLTYLEERKLSPRTLVETLAACGYELFTYGGQPLRARTVYDSPLPVIRFLARAK